jgi:hypothetical protein
MVKKLCGADCTNVCICCCCDCCRPWQLQPAAASWCCF